MDTGMGRYPVAGADIVDLRDDYAPEILMYSVVHEQWNARLSGKGERERLHQIDQEKQDKRHEGLEERAGTKGIVSGC